MAAIAVNRLWGQFGNTLSEQIYQFFVDGLIVRNITPFGSVTSLIGAEA